MTNPINTSISAQAVTTQATSSEKKPNPIMKFLVAVKNFFTEVGKWFFPCLKKETKVMEQKHTEPVPSERPKITPELMIADRKIGVTILEKRYDNPKISGADLENIKNQITRLKEEIESINVTVGLNEADSKRQKEIEKRMGYLDLAASSYHKEPEEEFFADAKDNQPWYKEDTQK